ncbi:TetR family transcriptional regulator [Nocardia sp. NPDC057030]|uniref:TetR family transcriptional regulator n=1 Tax=unclassified Nocardia TaxID=2637762 RepID=UPI0036339FF5
MTETGLREQSKARVRAQLVDAALRLFEEDGFDAVTVQQIADAAGVTRRTFHRHFPSKAAVVFAHEDILMDQLLTALTRRPATESVLTALYAAMRDLLFGDAAVALRAHQLDTMRRARQLLTTNPELRQANFTGAAGRQQALAHHFAERSGLPVSDLRIRLAAATSFIATGTGIDQWITDGNHSLTSLAAILDTIIETLAHGIDIPAADNHGQQASDA